MKDITWQESNVHLDENDILSTEEEGNDDDDERDGGGYNLFAPPPEEEFEIFEYNFPQLQSSSSSLSSALHDVLRKTTIATADSSKKDNINHMNKNNSQDNDNTIRNPPIIIKLKGHSEINNSTGLSMWLGSESLCNYILDHPKLIQGQNVMELGAGLGLCSITCCYLGAKQVVITDGDTSVLSNLRYNVKQNIPSVFCDDTILEKKDEEEDCEDYSSNNSNSSGVGDCADVNEGQRSDINLRVSCPQHIWGKGIDVMQKKYDKANVIIATDCVYVTQSLEPLWQSVDQLLIEESSNGHCVGESNSNVDDNQFNDGRGIFLYTNRCSSAAPIEMVLAMATKYGFTWSKVPCKGGECNGKNDDESDAIFLFWRMSPKMR